MRFRVRPLSLSFFVLPSPFLAARGGGTTPPLSSGGSFPPRDGRPFLLPQHGKTSLAASTRSPAASFLFVARGCGGWVGWWVWVLGEDNAPGGTVRRRTLPSARPSATRENKPPSPQRSRKALFVFLVATPPPPAPRRGGRGGVGRPPVCPFSSLLFEAARRPQLLGGKRESEEEEKSSDISFLLSFCFSRLFFCTKGTRAKQPKPEREGPPLSFFSLETTNATRSLARETSSLLFEQSNASKYASVRDKRRGVFLVGTSG